MKRIVPINGCKKYHGGNEGGNENLTCKIIGTWRCRIRFFLSYSNERINGLTRCGQCNWRYTCPYISQGAEVDQAWREAFYIDEHNNQKEAATFLTIVALAIPGQGGRGIPKRLTVSRKDERATLTAIKSSVDDNVGRVRVQSPYPAHCRDAGRSRPAWEVKNAVTANGD